MADKPICSIPDCGNRAKYRQIGTLCPMHYARKRRHGTTDAPPERKRDRVHIPWLLSAISAPSDDCLEWPGRLNSYGYGIFRIKRQYHYAHRYACEHAHGPPIGRLALHSCDNPACVNPKHLRWGTDADNVRDAEMRNRICRGAKKPSAKLTEQQARAIFLSRDPIAKISASYGIGQSTVSKIRARKKWRHATEGLASPSSAPSTGRSRQQS
jgi:hypothetical protein